MPQVLRFGVITFLNMNKNWNKGKKQIWMVFKQVPCLKTQPNELTK